jgi:hypothetical protein
MNALVTRYILEEDFKPEQSWRLAEWCIDRGGDAFSLSLMGVDGEPAPDCDALQVALTHWSLGEQHRPVVSSRDGKPTAMVPVWRADRESVAMVRRFFCDTLLNYWLDTDRGWLEDPVFWRGDEIMLAVISHEQEGVLRLTASEHREAQSAGFVTRESGRWAAW